MGELGSSNSHSSWETVFAWFGLTCLEGRPLCQCDSCEFKSWQFGRALDRDRQIQDKTRRFFESLPPFFEILPAEFFDDSELLCPETDACSVVFDQEFRG